MRSTSRPYPDTGVVPLVPEELEELVDGLDDEEGEDLSRVVVLAVQTAHHRARRAVLRHPVRRQLHDDSVNLASSFVFTRCVIIWAYVFGGVVVVFVTIDVIIRRSLTAM